MHSPSSVTGRRQFRGLLLSICLLPALGFLSAQEANSTSPNEYEKKTYVEQNGTQTMMRTLETEHHVTSDGEVEIQRYRAPAWEGDDRVVWEREVRTRKLPDGSVEKEYILRNPDGSGKMTPIQITHEKKSEEAGSTVIQREVLGRLGGTELQPVQREQITEHGPAASKQVIREVRQLNTVSLQWQTIDWESSSTNTSTVGDAKQVETKTVIQLPDAWGNLADFERKREKTISGDGQEVKKATVYRRDLSSSDNDHFFLLDDSTTQTKTDESGTTTQHVVRKSDLLYGAWERNPYSRSPEVVEERTTVEKTAPDGSKQTVTEVSGRRPAEPSTIRPIYKEERSDKEGYVRTIYIPKP